MTTTLALRSLSVAQIDLVSGASFGGLVPVAVAGTSDTALKQRKAGEGQKDFLKVTLKEALVSSC